MSDYKLLYVGAFAPDRPEFTNSATSRAAVLFQLDLLDAILRSDLPRPDVVSYFPVASFPNGPLVSSSQRVFLDNGLGVRSLANVNFGPLKILTLGLSAAWATLVWGWKNRKSRRVVVSYNLNAPPAFFLVPVCRLFGMEYVPFIGDIYVPGEVVDDSWMRRLEFALQRRAIKKSHGLVVCNESIIDDFAPGSGFLLVEGGVPESQVHENSRLAEGGPGFHIVFAGQLSELNGVQLLLDALEFVDVPGLKVTVMGDGPYADDVRRDALVDPRIAFLGLVPHDEVLRQYESADLLLNLRRTEYQTSRYVFPSKVVECLSTGVPLLSTGTGHVEREFGEFVFMLEDETPECLARTIGFIAGLEPSARHEFGARAQRYVLENKTWEAQVRKLGAYLDEKRAA